LRDTQTSSLTKRRGGFCASFSRQKGKSNHGVTPQISLPPAGGQVDFSRSPWPNERSAGKEVQMAKREYEFILTLSGVPELTREVLDALYESGCDDALIGMRDGVPCAEFAARGIPSGRRCSRRFGTCRRLASGPGSSMSSRLSQVAPRRRESDRLPERLAKMSECTRGVEGECGHVRSRWAE
jgi:hypothetical protein